MRRVWCRPQLQTCPEESRPWIGLDQIAIELGVLAMGLRILILVCSLSVPAAKPSHPEPSPAGTAELLCASPPMRTQPAASPSPPPAAATDCLSYSAPLSDCEDEESEGDVPIPAFAVWQAWGDRSGNHPPVFCAPRSAQGAFLKLVHPAPLLSPALLHARTGACRREDARKMQLGRRSDGLKVRRRSAPGRSVLGRG